jgi:hypothetical protein
MIAFRIYKNGVRVGTFGRTGSDVLTLDLGALSKGDEHNPHWMIGGLSNSENYMWNLPDVAVGDSVSVEIVELPDDSNEININFEKDE